MGSNAEIGRADTSVLSHPAWLTGWKFYRGALGDHRAASVAAVDASGAWFGFSVSAGTQDLAEKMGRALLQVLVDAGYAEAGPAEERCS